MPLDVPALDADDVPADVVEEVPALVTDDVPADDLEDVADADEAELVPAELVEEVPVLDDEDEPAEDWLDDPALEADEVPAEDVELVPVDVVEVVPVLELDEDVAEPEDADELPVRMAGWLTPSMEGILTLSTTATMSPLFRNVTVMVPMPVAALMVTGIQDP